MMDLPPTDLINISGNWCLIESDPGVFTELVLELGVKGVQFEELYSLDQHSFRSLITQFENVYGFIFLFKWGHQRSSATQPEQYPPLGLFFAKQVIHNACATQAILSVLLNNATQIELGPTLNEFTDFTKDFDPSMKGLAISNSDTLRLVHNSFKGQPTFELLREEDKSADKDAAFHFVSYIPFNNDTVYELDGLQEGPVKVGTYHSSPINGNDNSTTECEMWMEIVRKELIRRIETVQKQQQSDNGDKKEVEIRFNVLAVVKDRFFRSKEKLKELQRRRTAVRIQLMSFGEDVELDEEESALIDSEVQDDISATPDETTPEMLYKMVDDLNADINAINEIIELEKRKRILWAKENQLRKHDFTPLALCALRRLAKSGILESSYLTAIKNDQKRR